MITETADQTGRPAEKPDATPFGGTPDAERHVLAADSLRRRQLRAALLHGSTRSWRDRSRVWPAVLVGLVLTAVVLAAIAVHGAFEVTREQQRQEQQQHEQRQAPLPPGP